MRLKVPERVVDTSSSFYDEVVTAFRSGDQQAFRTLYFQFEKPIYRFCKHVMGDESLAGDAFQECFIKAYEHRAELRTNNVQSWLFTIARRVCLNLLRTRRGLHNQFDESLYVGTTFVQTDVYLQAHIDHAIQCLPLALREALILRDVEGYSYQEIADIVGIDLPLAKVRVHRARLHMRKLLKPIITEHLR